MRFSLKEDDISGSIPPRVRTRGILETVMKRLIVIPFNIPWNWSTDYTNQTAFALARKNMVICYMWGESFTIKEYIQKVKIPVLIKRQAKNIYLYYPILFIPFRRFRKIVSINQQINIILLKVFVNILGIKNRISKKILWIFDPRLYPLSQSFGGDYFLIYDCVDYFTGTARTEEEKELLIKYEHRLTNKASLVTANSTVLMKHLQKIRKDVYLVPQGFRVDSFRNDKSKTVKIKRGNRPLIGYLGAVNYRIDYPLLYKLARDNTKWDFALWGPLLEEDILTTEHQKYLNKLSKLPNVIRGQSDKTNVPGIIKEFDIGMIPYDTSIDFNKYCYPMKLFEYFYLGKPVISTPIKELKRFPKLVKIGGNYKQWQKNIESILEKPWPSDKIAEQRSLANKNSWNEKIAKIYSYL
jgi:hypothetical protein